MARVPTLADELVRLKPDVMVAGNTQAIVMRQVTAAIPIVAANMTDPIGFGPVVSHAPGRGNVNGMLANLDTLSEKQLALIADTINSVRKN